MNDQRFRQLKRLLASPGTTPSQLVSKARAARELQQAGIFKAAPADVVERVRAALEQLLLDSEKSSAWEADRAASIVGNVLDDIEQDLLARQPPECPLGASWKDPDLSPEQRLEWLSVDLLPVMAVARAWEIQWLPALQTALNRERIEELEAEADRLLAADDPLSETQAWLNANWAVPGRAAGLDGGIALLCSGCSHGQSY